MRKLTTCVAAALILAAGLAAAAADDAAPPVTPPAGDAGSPPAPPADDVAPSPAPPAGDAGSPSAPPAGDVGTSPSAIPPAFATPQDLVGKSVQDLEHGKFGAAAKDDIKALRRGPLLIHGNYCGIGNRPGKSPVDALDAACMRHDACTRAGAIPNCRCDERLRAEAIEVAKDAATRPDIRAIAAATAAGMAVLVCK